ncbi:CBS domain-containing protein [Thermococcus celer]|uniref:CBS domain-containing protein n=1 Tax=Thermococcus celer Vu 13 = JCM 8558 TaxID=1293037 RepID=A0A218P306_THECE|nr:CBS domain-containing protein [Thermococcus celer]ASI99320.1 CBS domain-containing protein [Thermococcus celer Vu 13 = JCM 8558]
MPRENSKNAKAKKITIIRSKRKLLQLKRKEELSHNIHYISKVPVRVVMDRDFLILSPDDPLQKLVQNLNDEETSAVVVDKDGRLLGFITMKDLLHFFEPPRRYSIASVGLLRRYSINRASRVEDIMVKKPITINVNDDLGRAIKIMLETGKHHLPVLDDEGRVRGVLEVKDIIRLIRIVST